MKHYYKLLSIIIGLPVILLLYANSSGSPGGRSGSPGDNNQTCTACHSGTAINQSGWISSTIPASGYTPGETYEITVNGVHSGVALFGFELTAENSTGQKVGSFALSDPGRTKLTNQNKAVTHTGGGTNPSGNNISWSVNWTAPATDVGQVGFYAALNAANGNGGTSGDVIYKTNLFVNVSAPAALLTIEPNTAARGETVEVTINAENTFWEGTNPTVSMSYSGSLPFQFFATSVTVLNNTSLIAAFDIPNETALGLHDVMVDDLTLPQSFNVTTIDFIADQNIATMKVYPNPATDFLMIDAAGAAEINIYNVNGKLLQSISKSENLLRIDISQLNSGLYIAETISGSSKQQQRFIKR